jgi:hypothetical protein
MRREGLTFGVRRDHGGDVLLGNLKKLCKLFVMGCEEEWKLCRCYDGRWSNWRV